MVLCASIIILSGCSDSPKEQKKQLEEKTTDVTKSTEMISASVVKWQVPEVVSYPERLQLRVVEFWTYFFHRQWDKCYNMESPENKQIVEQKLYEAYYNGGWKSQAVQVERVDMNGEDQASVVVVVSHINPKTNEPKPTVFKDQWRKVDGEWYHVFRDPILRLNEMKLNGKKL